MNVFDEAYSETEDLALIDDALKGSRSALEKLVKRHYNFIYNIAIRYVFNAEDAQDLAQEVVIKVITNLSQFKKKSSFRTWLYRIVVNHFLNLKRSKLEQQIKSFDQYGEALDNIPLEELTVEEQISYREHIEEAKLGCMSGMLLCLDRRQRLVFVLGEFFEVNSTIGATLMDISPANFRKLLSRARKDLFHFMQNKCGLVNTANPCRCSKKTKGFIRVGWVDKEVMQFNAHHIEKIASVVSEKVNACENLIEEKYAALYKSHPYYNRGRSTDLLASILDDEEVKQVFDL